MNNATTEKEEAIKRLTEWMPKGTTVYTILRSVSRSGMSHTISIVVPSTNDKGITRFIHPNWAVGKVLGYRMKTVNGSDALVVGGGGMDMGFHLVYSISSMLYGKNADGSYSHDGTYSLKQEWL